MQYMSLVSFDFNRTLFFHPLTWIIFKLAVFGALFGAQIVSAGSCPANTCYTQDSTKCTGLPLAQVNSCLIAVQNACNKQCS